MNKLVIYKTPDCRTCKMAADRLDAAGLPYRVVDVTEDPAAAQRLKDAGMLMAPVFGWKGKLRTIAEFPTIQRELATEFAAHNEEEKAA